MSILFYLFMSEDCNNEGIKQFVPLAYSSAWSPSHKYEYKQCNHLYSEYDTDVTLLPREYCRLLSIGRGKPCVEVFSRGVLAVA
jgi:hypothetical protein